MTAHLILRDGVPYSSGTVVADPLPDDMTAVLLTGDEWVAWREGRATWDGGKVVVSAAVDPEPDPIEARVAAVEAKTAAVEKALLDKAVLAAKDITDAAAAAEVVDVKP